MEKLAGENEIFKPLISTSKMMIYMSTKVHKEYIAELDADFSINKLSKGERASCKLPEYQSNCVIAHTHLNSLFPSKRDLITALCCCVKFKTSFHCVISKTHICIYQPTKKLMANYKRCPKTFRAIFKKKLYALLNTISTEIEEEYISLCRASGYDIIFLKF